MAEISQVIIVDINPVCRGEARRFLECLGIDAVLCADGSEAVECIGRNTDRLPDGVFFDVFTPHYRGVPDNGGYEELLRACFRCHLPFVPLGHGDWDSWFYLYPTGQLTAAGSGAYVCPFPKGKLYPATTGSQYHWLEAALTALLYLRHGVREKIFSITNSGISCDQTNAFTLVAKGRERASDASRDSHSRPHLPLLEALRFFYEDKLPDHLVRAALLQGVRPNVRRYREALRV